MELFSYPGKNVSGVHPAVVDDLTGRVHTAIWLTYTNHHQLSRLRQYANIVNQSVVVALKNYLTELIECCCLYRSKRDACRGIAKAQKLSLAIDSFKKSAREAQAILKSPLNGKFGMLLYII